MHVWNGNTFLMSYCTHIGRRSSQSRHEMSCTRHWDTVYIRKQEDPCARVGKALCTQLESVSSLFTQSSILKTEWYRAAAAFTVCAQITAIFYVVALLFVELGLENHHTRLYLTRRIHFCGFHNHRTTP